VCREKISELRLEELALLLQSSKHPIVIARAVDIYCSSKNWDQANSCYASAIEPILAELSQADVRRILLAPTAEGADLPGAHSFTSFVRYVYEHEKLSRDEIIQTLSDNGMEHMAKRLTAAEAPDDDIPF
jgi:hypothetical protein